MKNQEVWKDIFNFSDYKVSNLGRIKSLKNGNEKILKGKLVNKKRLYVNLYSSTELKQEQISVLVAIAFLNHIPDGHKIIVDHIDNNPLNNREDNLQLTTQRHNSSKDQKNRSSEYIGVFWDKSRLKWESRIWIGGKKYFLGRFENEIDAHNAYQNRLLSLN